MRNCCYCWKQIQEKKPTVFIRKIARFSFKSITELEYTLKSDLPLPADDTFHCNQRTTADKLEGLCILPRQMLFSCRYTDMLATVGWPVPEPSMTSHTVMNYIYDIHGHKLCQWNNDILDPCYFKTYMEAILNKEAALQNCLEFVDG